MSTISEAAERLMRHRTNWSEEYRDTQQGSDEATLASEYLRLTEPTPLTPEALKRVGFATVETFEDGSGCILQNSILRFVALRHGGGFWTAGDKFGNRQLADSLEPRTLGELRMLAMRLGIELKETE
jgi:hypothetical protein